MIIGLTGGIASGKSTAAPMLGARGAHRHRRGQARPSCLRAGHGGVRERGRNVRRQTSSARRRGSTEARWAQGLRQPGLDSELTDIVWPAIRAMAAEEIAATRSRDPSRVVVLEAAVLIEAGLAGPGRRDLGRRSSTAPSPSIVQHPATASTPPPSRPASTANSQTTSEPPRPPASSTIRGEPRRPIAAGRGRLDDNRKRATA